MHKLQGQAPEAGTSLGGRAVRAAGCRVSLPPLGGVSARGVPAKTEDRLDQVVQHPLQPGLFPLGQLSLLDTSLCS